MSDHRALAAATVTLRNMLSAAVRSLPGARIRTGPPKEMAAHEVVDGLINVFLYRVQPNATWRNEELPFRRADGSFARRPQLALDAHFLLSFYGDDERQIPNRLFGLALAMLHTFAYPPLQFIPGALGAGSDAALGADVDALVAGAGLEHQHHPLYFTPQPMSHDELTRLWAIFAQLPYVPSMAFLGTVLLIEPLIDVAPALPVVRTDVSVIDRLGPRIDRVEPAIVPFSASNRLTLHGTGLGASGARVRFDGDHETTPIEASNEALVVRLPEDLHPGPRLVDVVAEPVAGGPPVVSDPASFILQPTVLAVGVDPQGGDQAMLDVRFRPALTAAEPIGVLLNAAAGAAGGANDESFVLRATADPATPGMVRVPVTVPPGRYLVRIVVAGVSSPLTVDDETGPASGSFVGPAVTLR